MISNKLRGYSRLTLSMIIRRMKQARVHVLIFTELSLYVNAVLAALHLLNIREFFFLVMWKILFCFLFLVSRGSVKSCTTEDPLQMLPQRSSADVKTSHHWIFFWSISVVAEGEVRKGTRDGDHPFMQIFDDWSMLALESGLLWCLSLFFWLF